MNWTPEFNDGETPFDLSGLKDRSITNRGQLNEAEARNIAVATTKYLSAPPSKRSAPFTHSWMLKLHGEMFGKVWKWAGQTRTEDLNLGVTVAQINVQLLELQRDVEYRREDGSMSVVEQATRLHHRAVVIHPFQNGNGRWSRMLANIFLRQNGMGYVDWPEQDLLNGESSIRKDYLAALELADEGTFGLLLGLHEKHLTTM